MIPHQKTEIVKRPNNQDVKFIPLDQKEEDGINKKEIERLKSLYELESQEKVSVNKETINGDKSNKNELLNQKLAMNGTFDLFGNFMNLKEVKNKDFKPIISTSKFF